MPRSRIHDSTSMEELATAYILQVGSNDDPDDDTFDDTFDLMQRMLRRCGEEHTLIHIKRAREAYALLTGED